MAVSSPENHIDLSDVLTSLPGLCELQLASDIPSNITFADLERASLGPSAQ